jgi:PAS domain S-box-containing protein
VFVRFLFPELLPAYGVVSDTTVFGLAAVAVSAFSRSKLRAEARRKLAEGQLRTSERRLTLAQSAAHLGQWDCDLRTNTHAVFGEYLQLYGLPADHAPPTYEEWLGLVHPDDRERLQSILRESIERTHVWDTEFRVRWPDGSIHWLLGKGTVFLDDSGQPVRIAGVNLDITERKQAEALLRESEERFRKMADTAPVMIWISGPDKLCTFFNKGWLDFTGKDMDQELGNGWAEGVHPEDVDRCHATYSSSFDARCTFRMEYRLRRADGEYRWVLDDGVPLYRGDEFGGYIGSCIDVTEQRLAQERLRTNERRLIDAQRLAQVGSWERSLEADTICWSDEMLRILGLPNDPPAHFLTFLSRVHSGDRERIREADYKVRSSTGPVVLEYRIVRPDGEVRFVRSVAEGIRNDQDTPVRIVGATQDVTDRKRAEEERARLAALVEEERERLNAIISSIPGAVWETWGPPDNPAKQVKFMSNQVEEMLGYPVEQWMTAPGLWPLIVHPDDRSRFVREATEIFASDKGFGSHQYRCLTKDGRTVWLESHASVIREKTCTPIGLRGVTIDITESKEAQAALQGAQEELARVTRVISMGEVAASIAHEVNQPLAAVVTNGEACLRFLAAPAPNTEKAKVILTSIINDGNRASEVIRRIRALFAKASAQKEICDLNQLIRETILLLQDYGQSHNVLVRTHLEESLPPVFGDRTQLRQLLLNLVMNGIEATGKGLHEARLVIITTRSDAPPAVRLEVSDSGIGISSEDRERIFHPFFTTKEAGLGMGLSISRTIVESHGGRILVEPNQPHGARFLVFLPNERMEATRSATSRS